MNRAQSPSIWNSTLLPLSDPSVYLAPAIGFLLIALGMVLDEWRRSHRLESRRLLAACGLVLGLQVLELLAQTAGWLPTLALFVESASLVLILWAFTRPLFGRPGQADLLLTALLGVALVGEGIARPRHGPARAGRFPRRATPTTGPW